jgi:DNA polymerase III subunit gamma/tau
MDVLEIDAASNTQVENVREVIIAGVNIAPARDRYKVFIIDEVHMLSGHSFNALLKTIEEPPPRVVFIMATTDEHKVPETITSRCQIFEFRTIATSKIAERLRLIAKAEKISIADDAIREIARSGEGSMRDAQSALDQVISFAGEKISTEDVEKALGIVGADVLARVMNGIAENKPSEALAIVDDLVVRGHNLRNFCRDLLGHLRDLLVVKVSGDPKLLDSASIQTHALEEQAKLFSESDLVRFFHSLAETESTLRDAANPRYQVEVGLVKLMEMRRLASLPALIERIAQLENPVAAGSTARQGQISPTRTSAPAAGETAISSAASDEPVSRSDQSALSLRDQIKSALEEKKRRLLIAAIEGARRVDIEGDELLIEFAADEKHLRDTLAKADSAKLLRDISREVCGRELGLRFVTQAADAAPDEPPSPEEEKRQSRQKAHQAAAQNPVVQQALRTFGGEIVDIKLP